MRRDYLADPTIHLIWILNPILLEARRMAIENLGFRFPMISPDDWGASRVYYSTSHPFVGTFWWSVGPMATSTGRVTL
jgi:hypothetical protein